MMLMAKKQIKEDGVWLNMQDGHHKKMKKQEMKVFTMYEGWDAWKEKQLSAAKAPKKDGKGSPYAVAGSNADSIQESIYGGILLGRWKRPAGLFVVQKIQRASLKKIKG